MSGGSSIVNTEIWNKMAKPPTTALKTIHAGRLKGMSDINPQWRYRAMTEVFGPCGVGWKYTIDQIWNVPASEDQVFAFARVSLYVKVDGEWSEPIPGVGGSMLIAKELKGLHSSDEGYKMAVTDALSTACKMIGVAADIYMGRWDGSKYLDDSGKDDSRDKEKWELKLFEMAESTLEEISKWWPTYGKEVKNELKANDAAAIYAAWVEMKKAKKAPREPGEEG